MRLLRPAPGEIVDRQTILELKMKHGGVEAPVDTSDEVQTVVQGSGTGVASITRRKFKAGKVNIQPFIDEHEVLQKYLEKEWFPSLATQVGADIMFDQLYGRLKDINEVLWKTCDVGQMLLGQARAHGSIITEDQFLQKAADCLLDTIDYNNQRADVVKHINALFGVNVIEKIY